MGRTIEEARKLWEQLGEIPTATNGEFIDEPFLHFEIGTTITEIWQWFEDTYDVSVYSDLMFYKNTKDND